jgi:hypothetical protein
MGMGMGMRIGMDGALSGLSGRANEVMLDPVSDVEVRCMGISGTCE